MLTHINLESLNLNLVVYKLLTSHLTENTVLLLD